MDELVFLWHEYAKAHDKDLTEDAQDLKRQIRKFVQALPIFKEEKPVKLHGKIVGRIIEAHYEKMTRSPLN